MQLTIDIPDEQASALEQMSEQKHTPKENLVRAAILRLLAEEGRTDALQMPPDLLPTLSREDRVLLLDTAFGALRGEIEDGQTFQDRMRGEWDRETAA